MQGEEHSWLLLTYTLQAEPSSKRVQVWRRLRKAGAVLESGVWLIPETAEARQTVADLIKSIQESGGSVLGFVAKDLSGDQLERLKAAYNKVREDEYQELLDRCQRFLAHIERRAAALDFKFGAVEELEEDLEKRRRSYGQISSRDFFKVPLGTAVQECIAECESALAKFVESAFLQEGT